MHVHLIMSDFLDALSLAQLSKYYTIFKYFCKIISKIKFDCICNLFKHDELHAIQECILVKCRLQCLFLVIIDRLHIPSMIKSLKGNNIVEPYNLKDTLEKY